MKEEVKAAIRHPKADKAPDRILQVCFEKELVMLTS